MDLNRVCMPRGVPLANGMNTLVLEMEIMCSRSLKSLALKP